jgi:hypothetical protein
MRLLVGKRVKLPVVGGLFIGASVPLHPSKIFHDQSASAVFWGTFVLTLAVIFLWVMS